jgi:hypothetical protein
MVSQKQQPKQNRSAITGRYVNERYALGHPRTTVRETPKFRITARRTIAPSPITRRK